MNISSLIGETTEYDKKQAVEVKKPKSWCKSISAFANGRGARTSGRQWRCDGRGA